MKQNGNQGLKKDYLPIVVFCVLLVLLFITGYFAYKDLKLGIHLEKLFTFERQFKERFSKLRIPGIKETEADRFERLRRAGHRYFRKRQWDKAIQKYSEAIKIRPKSHTMYYWRARAYLNKGNRRSAIVDLKKSIQIKSSFYNAYDLLGWIYTEEKRWKEGIKYLNISISLRPDNGWAYYTRGRCYYYLGIHKMAMEDVKKACELGYKDGCKVYKRLRKNS